MPFFFMISHSVAQHSIFGTAVKASFNIQLDTLFTLDASLTLISVHALNKFFFSNNDIMRNYLYLCISIPLGSFSKVPSDISKEVVNSI